MTTRFMEINLLPEERVRDKYSFGIFAVTFCLLTVVTIAFGILGFVQRQSAQNDALSLQSVTANQMAARQEIGKLQIFMNQQNIIQSYMQGNSNILVKPLVNQILSIMPTGMIYTDIHISDNSVSISGSAQSLRDVAGFEDALLKLKQVSAVSLSDMTSSPKSGLLFSLKMGIGGGNGQ